MTACLAVGPACAQQAGDAAAGAPAPAPVRKALKAFRQAIQDWRVQQREHQTGLGLLSEYHGSVYEYLRNDALDAIPHEVHQGGGTASTLRRNQFGFTLNGPLPLGPPSDRNTHLSIAYERTRENIDRAFLATVPTLAERGGDFSDLVDSSGNAVTIYDPATTRPNPNYDPAQPVSLDNLQYLRDPFTGNQIPGSRIDPVALKLLQLYPAPNTNVGPYLTNNFFANAPEQTSADGGILTLDHDFSPTHHVSVGGADSVGLHRQPSVFGNDASPGGSSQSFLTRSLSLTDNWNVDASTVNQVLVRWDDNLSRSLTPATRNWPQVLGLSGLASPVFPQIQLNGAYSGMGRYNAIQNDDTHRLSLGERLSVHAGRNTWDFGIRYQDSHLHSFEAPSPSGNFQFTGLQTSLPGINDTGSPLAQLLLGDVSSMQANVTPMPMDYRKSITLFDLQDRYALLPNWQWTLGLTAKVERPRHESQNRMSTLDLHAVNPANGKPGAMVFGRTVQPVRTVLEPHAGFVLNPFNAGTVVRADYALGYQDYRLAGEQFGALGYVLNEQYLSPNDQLTPAFQLGAGVPQIYAPPPDLSATVVNGEHAQYISPTGTLPEHQNWQVQVEQPLSSSLTLRLTWNGVLATHQFVGRAVDLNALPPSALSYGNGLYDQNFNQSLRPYPQYTGIDTGGTYPYGAATYEGGTVNLEDRFTGGLMFQADYTFSKTLDDYSSAAGPRGYYGLNGLGQIGSWGDGGAGGTSGPQSSADLGGEKAISPRTRSQALHLNFLYELPLGRDGSWINGSDPLSWLLSDWSVYGFVTLQNGFPLVLKPMFNNTGGVADTLRVNAVPGVSPQVANPSAAGWFNPAAFAQPPDFTLGDYGRTSPSLRSPGQRLADLSLSRDVALSEARTLQIFVEAFNAFNHANLNFPDTVIGPDSSPNLHAGKITGSTGGRVVQLGMRLAF